MGVLRPRDCWIEDGYQYCTSNWHDWGRWVAFAVIVGVALIIVFLFTCHNARRRRRIGQRPLPGTTWMTYGPPPGPPGQQPYHTDAHYQQPPPQYTPPNPQSYGYFGGQPQQTGIELQTPPNAYHGGDRVYQPPPGPPPPNTKY